VRALNLASRPFRNQRLPVLLSSVVALAALGTTIPHGVVLARVLPSNLAPTERSIRDHESELARIEESRKSLRDLKPTEEQRQEWTVLRELVDRRVFRWTVLLARLNAVLPEDVHLTAIQPEFSSGVVTVRASATAETRGSESLLGLVRLLEEQPEFEEVVPTVFAETPEGDALNLSMRYIEPSSERGSGAAAPAPSPAEGSEP
jgi:Tfp pilus assembly protein PilN